MRIAVLILGLLGAAGAATLGAIWFLSASAMEVTVKLTTGQTLTEVLTRGVDPSRAAEITELQTALNQYHWATLCIWFLFGASLLGLLGAILAMLRKRASAVLLLAAFTAPLLIVPDTAVFTFFLAIAGLLALFIRPVVPAVQTSDY